ncbi:rhomboid family protein [Natrialba chahannaoensis JCM 10990]|uniref:Rhomboid family protein n=1 Tax=Natrialba chahannaoensis JCM 10990 TaxID=1227492 RepID=M0B5N6_9EURY|nr:rhomboid family intramembrane serine protease [Natrialba chahannaoensis]ELZ06231.1 rhomboid family protein [Natrialba chahannaoensis JCM 10990]
MWRTLRRSPATVAFLVIAWSLYAGRLVVTHQFGQEAAHSLFVVRDTHLQYVWTWLTAPFGHGNVVHLVVNSLFAASIGPTAERTFGSKLTSVGFLVSGLLAASLGTVLVVAVRNPFLSDPVTAAALGSSMGLFGLVGMVCERYRSHVVPLPGLQRAGVRNQTFFWLLLGVSVLGMLVDLWTSMADVSVPGLGHHFHLVGLLVGWVLSREVR